MNKSQKLHSLLKSDSENMLHEDFVQHLKTALENKSYYWIGLVPDDTLAANSPYMNIVKKVLEGVQA